MRSYNSSDSGSGPVIGLRGRELTEPDYRSLEVRWINKEYADRACLRRVEDIEGREISGRTDDGKYEGLVIPYVWPGENQVREYRLRRDHPDFEGGKPTRKYVSPPGRGNMLYFSVGTCPDWLADVSLPVIIVEGEFKAIALWRLASSGLNGERSCFLPIAIPGVWNWRGTIGKTTDATGTRVDEKGPIPDLSRIEWCERQVIVVFDADLETNDSVRKARRALTRELSQRGATVLWFAWPSGLPQGVKGVDDLLAAWGPDRVRELLDHSAPPTKQQTGNRPHSLVSLLSEVQLFHTPEREAYARLPVADHWEVWAVRGPGVLEWLHHEHFKRYGRPPTTQAVQETVAMMGARARFEAPERPVFVRIAEEQGRIFVDLCNRAWEAVEINTDGWKVVKNPPTAFRRNKGMTSLPSPIEGGSVDLLRKHINIGSDTNWALCASWLLAACRFSGPFPLLILQGEQGSAKSTMMKLLRKIVDPSFALVRTPPREERDFVIAANNSWVLAFDNLSGIAPWLADAFCRMSSGGGFSTRQLHSDSEEILFYATRPVIVNGIDHLADRPDLADRAIILNLPRIDNFGRRDERELYAEFERDLPLILGALYSALSRALVNLPEVALPQKPRMADFALWATAGEQGLGLPSGAFSRAYRGNRAEAVQEGLESDSVGAAVVALLDHEDQNGNASWNGTCKQLLSRLEAFLPDGTRNSPSWPKNPRALSSKLRRSAPLLREVGINVEFRTAAKGVREVLISRKPPDSTATTATHGPPEEDG